MGSGGSSTINCNSTTIIVINGDGNNVNVYPTRMFKALTIQSHEVLPNISNIDHVKNIESDYGHATVTGRIFKVHFHDGSHEKIRVDEVDSENYVIKFTMFEGTILGDKYEKITTVGKFELSADGKTIVKLSSKYDSKDNHEPTAAEITAANEKAVKFFKACEEYLIAHPNVCA